MATSTGPNATVVTLVSSTIPPKRRRKPAAAQIPPPSPNSVPDAEIETLVAAFKKFNREGRSLMLDFFADMVKNGVYRHPKTGLHIVQ